MITVGTQTEPCDEPCAESSNNYSIMTIKGEKDIAELIKIIGENAHSDNGACFPRRGVGDTALGEFFRWIDSASLVLASPLQGSRPCLACKEHPMVCTSGKSVLAANL